MGLSGGVRSETGIEKERSACSHLGRELLSLRDASFVNGRVETLDPYMPGEVGKKDRESYIRISDLFPVPLLEGNGRCD